MPRTAHQGKNEDTTDRVQRDVEDRSEQGRIDDEVNLAVKQLVAEELKTIIEESPKDILCTSYLNTRTSICSVNYNVVEAVMLYLQRKDIIDKTLDAHIATVLNTDAVGDRLSKMLLTWSSIIALIAMFVRHKSTQPLGTKILYLQRRQERTSWQPREHRAILMKLCQADWTEGVRISTAAGPPDAHRKIIMLSVKTVVLNNSQIRQSRQRKSKTWRGSQKHE